MKYYEVQTCYGSYRKDFRMEHNARKYAAKLSKDLDLDRDLIEIYPFEDEPTDVIITED